MFARNPAWTQDEEILLLDLYLRIGLRPPEDPDVIALSEFLQRLPIHPQEMRAPTFRNATGVSMKLRNVRHVDRRLPLGGLARGSALAERIWEEFAGDPDRLSKVAHAIRSAVDGAGGVVAWAVEDEESAPEGRILHRLHVQRERAPALAQRKKAQALARAGALRCEVCHFDFFAVYGELGRGFIECHHRVPLSELHAQQPTHLRDLALVCANCHRMLHRRGVIDVDVLREQVRSQAGADARQGR